MWERREFGWGLLAGQRPRYHWGVGEGSRSEEKLAAATLQCRNWLEPPRGHAGAAQLANYGSALLSQIR